MLVRQIPNFGSRAERSSVAIGDRAVGADEKGLRRTGDLQRCAQYNIWIRELWVGPGGQLCKLDSQIWPRVGVVDSYDHQIGLVSRCYLGQVWSFLTAWFAPLRPYIDHHGLTTKPGEPHLTTAAETRQYDIGESGTEGGDTGIGAWTVSDARRLFRGRKICCQLRGRYGLI